MPPDQESDPAQEVPKPKGRAKRDTKSLKERGNLFEIAMLQVDRAGDAIKLDRDVRAILSQPKNELIINFPVRLEDGTYHLFKGYRVQHNNLLGPFKGECATTMRPISTR